MTIKQNVKIDIVEVQCLRNSKLLHSMIASSFEGFCKSRTSSLNPPSERGEESQATSKACRRQCRKS